MKAFLHDIKFYLLNHFVNHVPSNRFRVFCYRRAGMKIGVNTQILMGCFVQTPEGIEIGNNTCINEFCYIDGRGGLQIGDNVSISMYSKVLTGTHDCHSEGFAFKAEKITIEDHVWIGLGSIVLPGSYLPRGSVLAAGSTAIKHGNYIERGMYSGVPAKHIGERRSNCTYQQTWRPRFR